MPQQTEPGKLGNSQKGGVKNRECTAWSPCTRLEPAMSRPNHRGDRVESSRVRARSPREQSHSRGV